MKKFFICFEILFLLSSNILYASEIPRPTFEEFCPSAYYHKEFIPETAIIPARFSTGEKAAMWSGILLVYPAFFTYPLAISDTEWRRKQRTKKIRNEYNNALSYWKQRELSFEQSLAICDTMKDKASCYLQVKMNEQQKDLAIQQNELLRGIGLSINALAAQQAMTNTYLQQLK